MRPWYRSNHLLSRLSRLFIYSAVWVAVLCLPIFALHLFADQTVIKPSSDTDTDKIHIAADELIYDTGNHLAEFFGNVQAHHGNTTIYSERLKLVQNTDVSPEKSVSKVASDESIKKIVATGNVRILFDDKVAVAHEATYIAKTKTMILSGDNASISSGTDMISGGKIILNTENGHLKIESSPDKRVEAVLIPGKDKPTD